MEKDSMPGVAAGQAFWQSALRQGGDWLQGRPEIFAQFQRATETWIRHRGEDYQRGLAAATQMAACRDINQAAAIQQKWLADCAQSLWADWMAMVTPMTEPRQRRASSAAAGSVEVERASEPAAD
ncbi:MAG TPA: hypothetical protein VMC10_04470 [Stellaceae bacterium]|nr:hypothetical protein [Stellaceae bacterium]